MPKLDQNAGLDVEFEPEAEASVELDAGVPTGDAPAPADEAPTTAPDEAPTTAPDEAPSDEEAEALEAAGVNIDEAAETKARKREHKLLMKDLKELGTLYGGGKTSMINLAERVTEAAMRKAITLADSESVYDQFRKAAEAKGTLDDAGVVPDAAIEERPSAANNDESRKAQVKKIEQFIEVGNKFDETAGDLVRRARNIHLEVLKGNRDTVKKGSTYTILVEVARSNKTRKESQGVMTDAELRDFLYVKPKPEAVPADEWRKVEQAIELAQAAQKGTKDRNAIEAHTLAGGHLRQAIEQLRSCLGAGAPERLAAIEKEEADKQLKADQNAAAASAKAKGKTP